MINVARSDVLGFRLENLKMWVKLTLVNLNPLEPDGLAEVRFVFDTGAVGILLSRETFEF